MTTNNDDETRMRELGEKIVQKKLQIFMRLSTQYPGAMNKIVKAVGHDAYDFILDQAIIAGMDLAMERYEKIYERLKSIGRTTDK